MQRRPAVFVFHDVPDADWFAGCVDEITAKRRILPLEEVARRRQKDTCALTFDDGRRSVVDVAHPVLAALNAPYAVFICTDVVMGGPVPWFIRIDHLASTIGLAPLRAQWGLDGQVKTMKELTMAVKEIRLDRILAGLGHLERERQVAPPPASRLFMTAADVRRLAAEGVSFGSHTRRHPILSKLTVEEQRHEIETSRDEIEALVGTRPLHLAYPNGSLLDFDRTTTSIVDAAGFTFGYTTVQHYLSSSDDPFALPRIGLDAGDPMRLAIKQLVPWLSRSHATERTVRARVSSRRKSASHPPTGSRGARSTARALVGAPRRRRR
jgi:peptidoglycan/xylan/chitin deacetylase (PgdA/CDA1 family)